MDKPKKKPETKTQAKPPALPPSPYVNLLRVTVANSEVHLAFGQMAPGQGQAHLVSSMVTTPVHAKAMLRALSETVERYEEKFGEIELPDSKPEAA
jgi:hypothetical protein